jgi:hypothetical protein
MGYATPTGILTPKRSMEFPKQSFDFSSPQQDLEAYPMPAPPAQIHHYAENQPQHRPSLSLLSSLANGASLADALRMSRSSILIEPNGSWSFVSAGQSSPAQQQALGSNNPFMSRAEPPPPMPSIPLTYAEEARKSMASAHSSSSFINGTAQGQGQMMPLSSHPVQMVTVPQGAYAQYQQHATPQQAQMQFHNAARELAAVHQQHQRQEQQQAAQQQQSQQQQQPARMTPPPLFSATHLPLAAPRPISTTANSRPSSSSRGSSAESFSSSSPSTTSGAVLRPAMKRASKSATAVLHDLPGSKQVSFVSSNSNRVSSMGFSTLVALADSVEELTSEQEREERGMSL